MTWFSNCCLYAVFLTNFELTFAEVKILRCYTCWWWFCFRNAYNAKLKCAYSGTPWTHVFTTEMWSSSRPVHSSFFHSWDFMKIWLQRVFTFEHNFCGQIKSIFAVFKYLINHIINMPLQYIYTGYSKCGTKTMAEVFRVLGFKVCDFEETMLDLTTDWIEFIDGRKTHEERIELLRDDVKKVGCAYGTFRYPPPPAAEPRFF